MQLDANTKQLLKEITDYKNEVEGRLMKMATTFSYNIIVKAIDTTPFGTMNPMYNIEARSNFGLLPMPGHAKGGWKMTLNMEDPYFTGVANSPQADNIKRRAKKVTPKFKLGDSVYITNSVPYIANSGVPYSTFGSLEDGYSSQAPDGIYGPTFDEIFSVYNMNLKSYFDEGT